MDSSVVVCYIRELLGQGHHDNTDLYIYGESGNFKNTESTRQSDGRINRNVKVWKKCEFL